MVVKAKKQYEYHWDKGDIAMGDRPIDRPLTPKEVEELRNKGTTSGGSPGQEYSKTKPKPGK